MGRMERGEIRNLQSARACFQIDLCATGAVPNVAIDAERLYVGLVILHNVKVA